MEITKEQFNSMQNICKKGKHKFRTNQYGVPVDKLSSMFFEDEKEIALNSFYNK